MLAVFRVMGISTNPLELAALGVVRRVCSAMCDVHTLVERVG